MAKKINFEDIVDSASLKLLLETLDKVEGKLKDILQVAGKNMSGNAGSYADIKKQVEAITQATQATTQLNEVKKEQIKIQKLQKQALEAEEGSYNKLKSEYDLVQNSLKGMGTETRHNTEEGKKMTSEAQRLYKALSDLKQETGKNKEHLGLFKKNVELASMSLGEMRKELMALRKTSFAGKSAEEIATLKQRMGDLADKMGDLKAEMAVLGGPGIGAIVGGLKFVAAGVESVVGSLSLFGVESEKIKDLEKKTLGLIAVTQALSEIEDVVNSGKLRGYAIKMKDMALNAKDTVMKWLNVAATNAQARAENAKAIMVGKGNMVVKGAAAVQWAWNAAMAANPIGLIIVAVAALATGIALLISRQKEMTAAQKEAKEMEEKHVEVLKQAAEESSKEILSIRETIDAIKSKTISEKKRKELVDDLIKQYPEYLSHLDREKLLLGDTKDAYERLNKAMMQKYIIDAYQKQVTEQITKQAIAKVNLERITIEETEAINKLKKENQKTLNSELISDLNNIHKIDAGYAVIEEARKKYNEEEEKTNKLYERMRKEKENLELLEFLYGEKTTKTTKENIKAIKELKKTYESYNLQLAKELDLWIKGQRIKDITDGRKKELAEWKMLYEEKLRLATDNIDAIDEINKLNIEKQKEINDKWDKENFEKVKENSAKLQKEIADEWKKKFDVKIANDKDELKQQQEQREKALTALEDYLKTVEDKRQRAMDREIDNSKRHQDMLRELAARGSEDAKDNLAYEEANQRKLEAKKEKELQRQKQIEMGMSVLKAYSKNIESSGGDTSAALSKTMKDAIILTAFIKSLPSFYKGTEDTGEGGKIDDKGGFQAILHPNERVMTAEQNKSLAGLTNWELVNAGMLYKKEAIKDNDTFVNALIVKKFDELKDEIKKKPSLVGTEYDGITHSIISIIENGNSLQRNHKRLSKLS